MISILLLLALVSVNCAIDTTTAQPKCFNGGTYISESNICACESGFSGSHCEFPFCDDTTLESKAEVAKSVLLQYLYYYESCPAITNVVVDSHMQSLEIQIRSFSKNSTYQQVIVKDPNGTIFNNFTTVLTDNDGLLVMVEGPVAPGRWEFLFSILPYPGGCELHISGMSDFGFNIGFTDSLQGDSPLENYTDATDFLILNLFGPKPATVEEMEAKAYLSSTTITTWNNAVERTGCRYEWIFGPIAHCYTDLIYWLRISGVDENNYEYSRTFKRLCEKEITTTSTTVTTTSVATTTTTTQSTTPPTTTTKDPITCDNGGTHVIPTNSCICATGFTGNWCQYPLCHDTNGTTAEQKPFTFIMLQYHYEHENCHSLTEQLVDSHIKLLQVEFQSLRKNTTVDVIITEPDGGVFSNYTSSPVTDGISFFIADPKPGRWQFLWNVLPYASGCEIQYFGSSDLYFDVGFGDTLQFDAPQDIYTDKTNYMIAHGYSLNTSTVEQLESKSYLQSTTMTTWATAIERRGCVFQYVFGPIFSCTPTLIYWLQISGVDDNNFPYTRVVKKMCQSSETTTPQMKTSSSSETTTPQMTTSSSSETTTPQITTSLSSETTTSRITTPSSSVQCDMGDKPMVPTYDVNNKSLAFVIDSTASMVQDRHRIFAMFKQLPSLADLYQKYVTVTFNDPAQLTSMTYFTQSDMANGLQYIANNTFSDGQDCPDYSLDGLYSAIALSLPGSPIFVFTDSSAKDPEKLYKVLKQLRIRQSQVYFIITGDCCGSCQIYETIAEASLGRVFHMGKPEIINITGIITSLGSTSNVLSMDRHSSCNSWDFRSFFFVDDSISEFSFSVTGTRPVLTVMFDESSVKYKVLGNAGNNYFYSVPDTQPGLYRIRLQTFDVCYIQVLDRSPKQFQLGFVTIINSDAENNFPFANGNSYYPTLHAAGFEAGDLITNVDVTLDDTEIYNTAKETPRDSCAYEILLPEKFQCLTVDHRYKLKISGVAKTGSTFQRLTTFSCVDEDIGCAHGGTSYFGHCVCTNGYGGKNCETQTTSTAFVSTTSTTSITPSTTTVSESTTIPTQSITSASESTTTPTESVTTAIESTTTPTESVTTAIESTTTPTQFITTASESATTSTQSVTTTTESTTTPTQSMSPSTTRIQSSTTMPTQSVNTSTSETHTSTTTSIQSASTSASESSTSTMTTTIESMTTSSFETQSFTATQATVTISVPENSSSTANQSITTTNEPRTSSIPVTTKKSSHAHSSLIVIFALVIFGFQFY